MPINFMQTKSKIIINLFFVLTMLPVLANAQAQTTPIAQGNKSFAPLAKKLLPSVVGIRSSNGNIRDNNLFANAEATIATGSGFIYDNRGFIITNNHVIENGREFEVSFNDGTVRKANLIGRDIETDIAVLKMTAPYGAPPANIANSDAVEIGDWAIAIGSPFGLGNSFSVGVISGRNRDLQSGRFDNFLQTDAAINSGNSGGPLFNEAGQVIGVNTAIVSGARGGGNIGIGFAIPSNIVKRIAGDIIQYGYVRRGYAGFRARNANPNEGHGVVITAVDNNGSGKIGGLRNGDIYFAFNNKPINDARQLARMISDTPIGQTIRLDGLRGKKRIFANIKITLPPSLQSPQNNGFETIIKTAGMSLRNINGAEKNKYGADANVIVIAIDPYGKAKNAMQSGDIILEVGGQKINSASMARNMIDGLLRQNKIVIIKIKRNNRIMLRIFK
jgi:serine protease Do